MKLLIPIEKLPDRPSALIRTALLDISACSQDFRYRVDTDHDFAGRHFWDHAWHRLDRSRRVCMVCMAGAVMAKSLYVAWGEDYSPEDFEPDTQKKLMALNEFRQGEIHRALVHILDYPNNPLEVERKITPYAQSRRLFFAQMNRLANDLEERGL